MFAFVLETFLWIKKGKGKKKKKQSSLLTLTSFTYVTCFAYASNLSFVVMTTRSAIFTRVWLARIFLWKIYWHSFVRIVDKFWGSIWKKSSVIRKAYAKNSILVTCFLAHRRFKNVRFLNRQIVQGKCQECLSVLSRDPSGNLIGCDSLVGEFWCRIHPLAGGTRVKQVRCITGFVYNIHGLLNHCQTSYGLFFYVTGSTQFLLSLSFS